eukprot:3978494-Prymnesium_polylepis.1
MNLPWPWGREWRAGEAGGGAPALHNVRQLFRLHNGRQRAAPAKKDIRIHVSRHIRQSDRTTLPRPRS